MTVHVSRVLTEVMAAALSLAAKHKLEADGTIWCWNCGKKPALMPSLHCHTCLAAHFKRRGLVPTCINREQTAEDVEKCK